MTSLALPAAQGGHQTHVAAALVSSQQHLEQQKQLNAALQVDLSSIGKQSTACSHVTDGAAASMQVSFGRKTGFKDICGGLLLCCLWWARLSLALFQLEENELLDSICPGSRSGCGRCRLYDRLSVECSCLSAKPGPAGGSSNEGKHLRAHSPARECEPERRSRWQQSGC